MTAIVLNNTGVCLCCADSALAASQRDPLQIRTFSTAQNRTRRNSPSSLGRQIGRMKSVIGTRSLRRSSAMSLSKFVKLKSWTNARSTKRVSGRTVSLQRSCSPNVTRIINQRNLKGMETIHISRLIFKQKRPSPSIQPPYLSIGSWQKKWTNAKTQGYGYCHKVIRW